MSLAFLSALLFAFSIPASKFLTNYFSPLILSSIYYISMFLSSFIFKKYLSKNFKERFNSREIIYLLIMIISGGVIAPVFMIIGINKLDASTASLLSNFELIFTIFISIVFVKESKDNFFWIGFFLSLIGLVLLNFKGLEFKLDKYSVYILLAMFFWGIDNNITAKLSDKDPLTLSAIKGFFGGLISIILSVLFEDSFFTFNKILFPVLVGCFCYALSVVLLILSFRNFGVSKSSIVFNSYPFIAFILSIILLDENINILSFLSFIIFASGIFLIYLNKHKHSHSHLETHIHLHKHDEHHLHHLNELELSLYHSHIHTHNIIQHEHLHYDDSHHRHH